MEYLLILLLLILSALFSGLTLGLLSLNTSDLQRKTKLGDVNAEKILEVRANGNLLLVTLLIGNVLVNVILSIFLGSIMSGVFAAIISTTLIVVFGEILPQAFFSKHALQYAPRFLIIVKFLILFLYPVSKPISWVLDKMLGHELETIWSKDELEEIIKDHELSEFSDIDSDEQKIILGALEYSDKRAGEVMTHKDSCFLLSLDAVLTDEVLEFIKKRGFTRIPIYQKKKKNIVGILHTKDLITLKSVVPVSQMYRKDGIVRTSTDETLDDLLNMFIRYKKHMAYVLNSQRQFVGLITLEDIVEEIIKTEIVDEHDKE